jgi:alpha-L-arabinofuranosidase
MKSIHPLLGLLLAFPLPFLPAAADPVPVQITVDLDAEGLAVAPTMHGLFYEDINYAADGGIYAELVQNRSFEHNDPLYAWSEVTRGSRGSFKAGKEEPLHPNNPTYVRITSPGGGEGYGIANSGFAGVPVKVGETYLLSLYARSPDPRLSLSARLESRDGRELARVNLPSPAREWQKIEARLSPMTSDPEARLVILVHRRGQFDLDMVSLFPEKTFRGRTNGMRPDIAQALADMQPRFLRFPGGCIAEGHGLHNAYRWKDTVGDVARRPQNFNLWRGPAFPEYHQTFGLGYFEYFQLAEDFGAEPVPVVNCGMACQARRGVHAPLDQLDEWVQDALDLIEFANGPADSTWGALRASMGRQEPFNLRFLTIGNEQWGQEYFDRYEIFHRVLSERHPEIKLISTSGPFVDDPSWRLAWDKFNSGEAKADLVDEHYYVSPDWLLTHSDRYERYDRNAPKVQVGEFAAHDEGRRSTLRAALAEASYMTGLLRNADVVEMIAYAPLLARRHHAQWEPNLIWFDNSQVLLTPSYHVQALYGQNRPDRILPTDVRGEAAPAPTVGGRIALGTWNTHAEYRNVKVTAPDGRILFQDDFSNGTDRWEPARGDWSASHGVLRQTDERTDRRAYAGSPEWRDYTLSLQARKISGREGFMVFFGAGQQGLGHWNLGGWENTLHGLSIPGLAVDQQRGRIETNRWYDIRIELTGSRIAAYLDNELLQSADLAHIQHKPLYAVAGRDDEARELVLFLANPAAHPVAAVIDLRGGTSIGPTGRLIRLTGESPDSMNTFEAPDVVAPRETRVEISGPAFESTLPPFSFSVLRMPLEPGK